MKSLWFKLFLAALAIFLLGSLLPAEDRPEERDVIKVRAYPQMGMSPLRNVLVMIEIKRPERFWCPAIEVIWWEGNVSTWEADCDPLEEGEEPEDFYKSFRLGEKAAFTQTAEIIINIKQGKHFSRQVVKITVAGS